MTDDAPSGPESVPADEATELMLRLASGDEAALEPLVALVRPRLLGFFRRLGADRALAEDCAQETLLKIYRLRERYEPRARFLTYLFHVARNHWIDVVRHRRAGPRIVGAGALEGGDEDAGPFDPAAPPEEPGRPAASAEAGAAIRRALAALTAEHRETFVLALVQGLAYPEVARVLGVPLGTVKSRMHAALRQVRESLRREGIEP